MQTSIHKHVYLAFSAGAIIGVVLGAVIAVYSSEVRWTFVQSMRGRLVKVSYDRTLKYHSRFRKDILLYGIYRYGINKFIDSLEVNVIHTLVAGT